MRHYGAFWHLFKSLLDRPQNLLNSEHKNFERKLLVFVKEHKKFEVFLQFLDRVLQENISDAENDALKEAVAAYANLANWSLYFAQQYQDFLDARKNSGHDDNDWLSYYENLRLISPLENKRYQSIEKNIDAALPILQRINKLFYTSEKEFKDESVVSQAKQQAWLRNFCVQHRAFLGFGFKNAEIK